MYQDEEIDHLGEKEEAIIETSTYKIIYHISLGLMNLIYSRLHYILPVPKFQRKAVKLRHIIFSVTK
jgi:hypothetical protein